MRKQNTFFFRNGIYFICFQSFVCLFFNMLKLNLGNINSEVGFTNYFQDVHWVINVFILYRSNIKTLNFILLGY